MCVFTKATGRFRTRCLNLPSFVSRGVSPLGALRALASGASLGPRFSTRRLLHGAFFRSTSVTSQGDVGFSEGGWALGSGGCQALQYSWFRGQLH